MCNRVCREAACAGTANLPWLTPAGGENNRGKGERRNEERRRQKNQMLNHWIGSDRRRVRAPEQRKQCSCTSYRLGYISADAYTCHASKHIRYPVRYSDEIRSAEIHGARVPSGISSLSWSFKDQTKRILPWCIVKSSSFCCRSGPGRGAFAVDSRAVDADVFCWTRPDRHKPKLIFSAHLNLCSFAVARNSSLTEPQSASTCVMVQQIGSMGHGWACRGPPSDAGNPRPDPAWRLAGS